MAAKGIIVIAPSPYSLIATSACELLMREGVQIQAVVIKKFSVNRFRQEFRRDGKRLLKKIWQKLVLKEKAYAEAAADNIINFRKEHNIELKDLRHLKNTEILSTDDLNGEDAIALLKKYEPTMCLFTGGGLIREQVLALAGKGVLNCHMGILPRYKGMDVVEWPLLLNDKDNVGVTTHFMDKGVDTGRIIAKEYIKPRAGETITQLRRRFEPVMVKNLVQSTMDILNDMAEAWEQEDRGHQYFIMHPRLAEIAAENLKKS